LPLCLLRSYSLFGMLRDDNNIWVLLYRVSNDPELYQKVAGVLIESNGVNGDLQGQYSEPASLCFLECYFAYFCLIPKNVLFIAI